MTSELKLVLSLGKNKGREFVLKEGENLVGRCDPDSEESLAIDLDEEDVDAKVSRQHAVLIVEGGRVYVEDLGSLNGTFVMKGTEAQQLESGARVELEPGSEVVFGKISFRLIA